MVPIDFNILTSKQKKVYSAIESFIKINNIPPTVREIGEILGEKTPGAVQGILNRLEQKGVIKRGAGMARSIQLLSDDSQYIKPIYLPELKKISVRNINDLLNIYNIVKYHPVSPDLLDSKENCFIINYTYNSQSESDVKHYNLLVISINNNMTDGDTVLVLHENRLSLRKYCLDNKSGILYLKACNNSIDNELSSKNEVIIIGKLVGKFSRF